jgi:1-acyl-sn-glycerol-3-phosphate acyltransferase
MKRATLQSIVRGLLTGLALVEFSGTEHLPAQGGVIVTTNHMSQLDTATLFINPGRTDITALITDKYQKYFFFKWFVKTAGGIWIDRTKADFSAFRAAIDVLKKGQAVGIAPEGTRSTTAQLLEGKPGTVLLAIKAGVPIVPVGIYGSENAFNEIFSLKRPHIHACFGPAYTLPPLDRENRDVALQWATDEVMCRIAAVLPQQYWGFYASHPRMKELLAQGLN